MGLVSGTHQDPLACIRAGVVHVDVHVVAQHGLGLAIDDGHRDRARDADSGTATIVRAATAASVTSLIALVVEAQRGRCGDRQHEDVVVARGRHRETARRRVDGLAARREVARGNGDFSALPQRGHVSAVADQCQRVVEVDDHAHRDAHRRLAQRHAK